MLPAGKYYVGDLCYVMNPEWREVCDLTFSSNAISEGEFTLADGRRFALYNTLWGDGSYRSNIDTYHCVDAGCIGVIRLEDIQDPRATEEEMLRLGAIVDFAEDFDHSGGRTTDDKWDGTIRFGNVQIYTGFDDESEELDEDFETA